jgi:hypothetical protein
MNFIKKTKNNKNKNKNKNKNNNNKTFRSLLKGLKKKAYDSPPTLPNQIITLNKPFF